MVAAIYGVVEAIDISNAEDLCGSIIVTLLSEGLPAVQDRVAKIRLDEESGAVESPEFLDFCRRRVAELDGP